MDPRFVGAPATPQKSVSSVSWDTPSQASNSSAPTDAGARLELISIFGDESSQPILQDLPNFKAQVFSIVNGERQSAMKPQSTKKFRIDFNDVKSRNEATLHERIMPHIIKSGKTVVGENAEDVYKEFREDGLDRNVDADFSGGSVPIPPSHALEKNLERLFGVKNPKPDYTFGFDSHATRTRIAPTLRHLIRAFKRHHIPVLYHGMERLSRLDARLFRASPSWWGSNRQCQAADPRVHDARV